MGWMDGRACVALRGRACASGRVLSCVCACSCVRGRAFGRACTRGVCVCVFCSRVVARACSRAVCVRAWSRVGGRPHTHARPTHNSRRNRAILCPASDRRGPPRPQLRPHAEGARGRARRRARLAAPPRLEKNAFVIIICHRLRHERPRTHDLARTTTHDHAHTTPFPPAGVARPTPSPTDGVPRTHRSPCNDYRITNDSQYWNWAFQKVGAQLSRTRDLKRRRKWKRLRSQRTTNATDRSQQIKWWKRNDIMPRHHQHHHA